MKKITLTLLAILTTGLALAQSIDSIPHHFMGHTAEPVNIMQMSDGSILGETMVYDIIGNYNDLRPVGNVMHKVSRHGGSIIDTLLIPSNLQWSYPFKDPSGKGYLYAEMLNDMDGNTFNFRMSRFDEHLNFDSAYVVDSVMENTWRQGFRPGMTLDPNNDLVLAYYDYYNTSPDSASICVARLGIDGHLKHRKLYTQNEINIYASYLHWGPKVFSETPLRYCIWGAQRLEGSQELHFYVLDSLFDIEASYTLDGNLGYPISHGYDGHFSLSENILGLQDGNFLIGVPYSRTYHPQPEVGVMLRKYDRDFNKLKELRFPATHYFEYAMISGSPFIGLEHSRDGGVYLAYYNEQSYSGYYNHYYGQLVVVKMDEDLNTLWVRYCLEPEGYGRYYGCMTVLEDNGVAVIGNIYGNDDAPPGALPFQELFYVIVNDDYDGIFGQDGVSVRPYGFWPNPAKDFLRLEFSPDVTPKKIDLYDLQGRLVRRQTTALECINMEGLAAGTYMMRVTLEGGKVFSDKVVKE